MGSGKTAVLSEASDLLAEREIVHAAIDLDMLGLAHLPSKNPSDGVMFKNLRSICHTFRRLGVMRFLVARALEDRTQLQACRDILQAASTVVCPITASIETMKQRTP